MAEPLKPAPAPPAAGGGGDAPAARAAVPGPGAGHPAPPVFSPLAFVLVTIGTFGAAAVAPLAATLFGDRLALPDAVATGLAALAAALFGGAVGALAAVVSRRLAFYEVAAAALLWAAAAALVSSLPQLRAAGPLHGLEAQGTLVVVLGLLGAGLLSATAVFAGATLAYLAVGTGRFDPSLSYELFVARSHLRLSPRTVAALFGIVVTGLVPGLLVALGWSLVRDVKERRAYRRGELFRRGRMPATLLDRKSVV
jgi:lipoprotein-releasing system permease protein